jgi:hypothetical protein
MAYGIVLEFPGGTEAQYRATIAAVHPPDGDLPDGQTLHLAGATGDGWLVVVVHDSEESWARLRDDALMPRLRAGSDDGFEVAPRETTFEVRALKRLAAGG